MIIRVARSEEAPALSQLAMASKASWGYPAEQMTGWSDALTITPASVVATPTFVAETGSQGNEIAGFYQLGPARTPWALEHLWVHPDWMRRGIGCELVTHASAYAHRQGVDRLEIDADPHAELFYLACGATRVGSIPAPIPGELGRLRPQLLLLYPGTGVSRAF